MALNIKVSSSDWIDLRTRGYTPGMYLLNAVGAAIEYSTAATPVPGTTLVGSSAVLISGTYLWVRGSGDCELYTASEWSAANVKTEPLLVSTTSSGGVGNRYVGGAVLQIGGSAPRLARKYPASFDRKPLRTVGIPFGTAAITEAASTGATLAASVDNAALYDSRPTTKIAVTAAGSNTVLIVGRPAMVALDADAQKIDSQPAFFAAKSSAGQLSRTNAAEVYFGDASLAAARVYSFVWCGRTADGWDVFQRSMSNATIIGSPPALTDPQRARVRIYTNGPLAVDTINITPVFVLPAPRPTFIWTNDDGYDEWWWLSKQAAARQIPLSFGIAKNYVGTAGFLTAEQILKIRDMGHEITNHALQNDSYASIGLNAYQAAVNECRDYLTGLGINPRAASLHQYVQGSVDAALIASMQANGYLSARSVSAGNKPALESGIAAVGAAAGSNNYALYNIPAAVDFTLTTTVENAKTQIDNASKYGAVFGMGHRYEAAAGTITWVAGYDANNGVLNFMDWLADQRDQGLIDVKTWLEWYDDQFDTLNPFAVSV